MSQLQETVESKITTHKIYKQDDRVWLEKVPHQEMVYSWDCSLRGLRALLNDQGMDISFEQLMALSGDAFFVCFAKDMDTYPELVMPTDPLKNATELLGYDSHWLITTSGHHAHLSKTVPVLETRRQMTQQVLDAIYKQINDGHPVLVGGASELGCGNWSLVTGYDKDNEQLCHNGLDGLPAGTWQNIRGINCPINDTDGNAGYWNGRPRGNVLPDFQGGWLVNPVFILGNQTATPVPREVALMVLRRAIDLYHAKPVHFFGGMHYFGEKAYQQWIKSITTMEQPQDLSLDQLVRGRAAASVYCRSIMMLFPDGKANLQNAVDAYDKLVAIANETFADFIPFDWDNPKRQSWGNGSQRQQQAQALQQMAEQERIAIEAIRLVVMRSNVVQDADKVWIKGADGFSTLNWLDSVHGSQAQILEAMQTPLTYGDLIGYSGFAFRVMNHEAMCPSAGHPCVGVACVENGNKALPWTSHHYQAFPWSEPKKDQAAFEAQVCKAIKKSIDQGIPVHYGSEEDGLIIGYANEGKRWWCVHPYYKDGKQAFWLDELEPQGIEAFAGPKWPWGVCVWEEPKRFDQLDSPKTLTINALKQAITMWDHKIDPNASPKPQHVYFSGDQAYDKWIGWLVQVQAGLIENPKSGMQGNAWCYAVLVHSRQIAANWLKQQANLFDGDVHSQLLKIADTYAQIPQVCLKDINSTWELFMGPDRFEDWTDDIRSEQINRLQQVRELDRTAVQLIRYAIEAVEHPVLTLTGSCLCGKVKYQIKGKVLDQNYCDCTGCQHTSGALRTPWMVFERSAMTLTAGKLANVRGDTQKYTQCEVHGQRGFCPDCGSHMFWFSDRGDTIDVAAGCLDDTSVFKPGK